MLMRIVRAGESLWADVWRGVRKPVACLSAMSCSTSPASAVSEWSKAESPLTTKSHFARQQQLLGGQEYQLTTHEKVL